jgi:signal peptidase II
VIDFIDIGVGVHRWPVFNVADMGVSVGATLLLIYLLRAPREEGGRSAAAVAADDPPPRPD